MSGTFGKGGASKKDSRRMSSTGPGDSISTGSKENRRPLTAVLSEDHLSTGQQQQQQQQQSQPKQSLLSKFTTKADARGGSTSVLSSASSLTKERSPHGGECDKIITPSLYSKVESDRRQLKSDEQRRFKDPVDELSAFDGSRFIGGGGSSGGGNNNCDGDDHGSNKSKSNNHNNEQDDDDDDDDDNNQVVPQWPSKSDAIHGLNSGSVQHKVYSLKDYSQVSNPSVSSIQQAGSSSGKLLKSMSQDRKVKANTKRLSECIYTSGGPAHVSGSSLIAASASGAVAAASAATGTSKQQRNPSVASQIGSASFSMGPATSVNSLLPNTRQAALLSESRMDRMRKLFVSPLSLRSGSSSKVSSDAHRGATANPRLSLQSGASMLNKPHHLMHAMYRTRAVAHHSRRSPMRQKQGKSFRVFGCPLQMANNIYPITCFGRADIYKQQSVPYILARLCNYIEENSSDLTHEGIFRVSGNARLMEKLRTLFDHLGDAPLESESVDVATSASMLKMYLRELPEPLIPTRMNYYFIALAKKYSSYLAKDTAAGYKFEVSSTSVSDLLSENQASIERHRVAFLRDLTKLVRKLPIENYNLLKYLACFLYRVSLKQQYNKMCAEALGIVFGPNVFRIRSESYKGLKEQELSNQIMASIISNYKSIFDSELTDPLGNLVEYKEDNDSGKISLAKTKIKQLTETTQNETQTFKTTPRSFPISTVAPIQSTSSGIENSREDVHNCCPKHCQTYLSDVANPKLDDDDDEDVEDEDIDDLDDRDLTLDPEVAGLECQESDDDGEDCDEDESYTPSSDSDSYCSSMDSETIESSYDGAVDGYRQSNEDDDKLASHSNLSSSQCATDTSYTPSSSHSESDGNDDEEESFNGHSSSFGSNSSFNRRLDGDSESTVKTIDNANVDNACQMCKRRESAQMVSALSTSGRRMCDSQSKSKTMDQEGGSIALVEPAPGRMAFASTTSKKIDPEDQADVVTAAAAQSPEANASGEQQQQQLSRQSRRRRTEPSHGGKHGHGPRAIAHEVEQVKHEIDADRKGAGSSSNKTKHTIAPDTALPDAPSSKSRREHTSRSNHKYDFLRRRSSSASSLTRMRHKHDRLTAPQRRNQRAADDSGCSTTRPRVVSERRKFHHEAKHRASARRSRGKSTHQSARRFDGTSMKSAHPTPARAPGDPSSNKLLEEELRARALVHNIPEDLSAMNLPVHLSRDPESSIDLLNAGYLEDHEGERYFLLRSFNSDETLLRSLNYCSEFPQERCIRTRRRFSGYDFEEKVDILPSRRPFDQIMEAMGRDAELELAEEHGVDLKLDDYGSGVHHEATFGASIISLLDNQVTGFRRSELSINDVICGEDPILTQMKAMKDLTKALKKLLKHRSSCGPPSSFNRKVELTLLRMAKDSDPDSDYSDDSCLCYIDYLSAKDLAASLEEDELDSPGMLECATTKTSELTAILNVKITLFKQRYNDLKNIRDHCLRNHLNQQSAKHDNNRQADSISRNSDVKSLGSLDTLHHPTTATLGVDHMLKKLSVSSETTIIPESHDTPSRQSFSLPDKKDQSACCSSNNRTKSQREPPGQSGDRSLKQTSSSGCKYGSLCPIEFVFNIEKQLALKRVVGLRVLKLNAMNIDQLRSEKLELQKNLLRYEHWFGRPITRLEFSFVGHLYERYRAVKIIISKKMRSLNE